MEICTLEFVKTWGPRKESVVLYFKDRQAAEDYKAEYLDNEEDVILEDDAIGFQYFRDEEFWSEINDNIMDNAMRRLSPPRVQTIEPTFYQVRWVDNDNESRCKMHTKKGEALDHVAKLLDDGESVNGIYIEEVSLERMVEMIENA